MNLLGEFFTRRGGAGVGRGAGVPGVFNTTHPGECGTCGHPGLRPLGHAGFCSYGPAVASSVPTNRNPPAGADVVGTLDGVAGPRAFGEVGPRLVHPTNNEGASVRTADALSIR